MMVKNYRFSFATDKETADLIKEVLNKLNNESNININNSDLISVAVKRFCMMLKCGKISSSTFLYNHHKK